MKPQVYIDHLTGKPLLLDIPLIPPTIQQGGRGGGGGGGSSSGGLTEAIADGKYLQIANNLSDVADEIISRTNLLPSQAANSGKFLTTDGTDVSWASVVTTYTRAATKIIASSTSLDTTNADYICDGTADDVQIQAAIDALPSTGGRVLLM